MKRTDGASYSDGFSSSFTAAVGLALGELLLLSGRPEELPEHLRQIQISAQATILSSGLTRRVEEGHDEDG